MPQAIIDNAMGGDVVVCMGAGSIGLVPAKLVVLLGHSAGIEEGGRSS
jgi:UDP-N-acetylmuramate--alanine ligase